MVTLNGTEVIFGEVVHGQSRARPFKNAVILGGKLHAERVTATVSSPLPCEHKKTWP